MNQSELELRPCAFEVTKLDRASLQKPHKHTKDMSNFLFWHCTLFLLKEAITSWKAERSSCTSWEMALLEIFIVGAFPFGSLFPFQSQLNFSSNWEREAHVPLQWKGVEEGSASASSIWRRIFLFFFFLFLFLLSLNSLLRNHFLSLRAWRKVDNL